MPAEVAQNTEVIAPAATPTTTPESKSEAPAPAPNDAAKSGEAKQGENAAPKTALEAATRVMAKGPQKGSEGKPADGTQPPAKTEAKAEGEAEEANLPWKDDPRWKKMSSELRILQVAKDKNEEAIKVLEPKARTHDDLNRFVAESNLSKDDFQSGLVIMRAIRNDPAQAYELMRPVMERLESMVGVRLPQDLHAKVQAGTLDAEAAHEIARARGSEAIARSRAETLEQQQAREVQEREERSQDGQIQVIANALNAAEEAWMKSDPDAAKLKPLMNRAVLLNGQLKPPRDAEEARALWESSLREVRNEVGGFMPQARAKDGNLPVGGAPVTTAPIAKSSLEAAQAALSR